MAPDKLEEIGQRIRKLRQAAEMTLRELAERADLTPGFISQLERGKVSISIDSLMMILDALNIHIADFFRPSLERFVFREQDQVHLEREGVKEFVALVLGAGNREMEPMRVHLAPGEKVGLEPFSGEQFGYVLSGRITVQFGKRNLKARRNDTFYASGDSDLTLENTSGREAVFLWITSPPYF
ncbi:MAG: XRE family transcriptional regulator [bacterium]